MTNEEKPGFISAEDLAAIKSAKANAAYMRALAEKAAADQKSAELEAKNLILLAYLKYGMTNSDSINPEDGAIIRVVAKEEPQQEQQVQIPQEELL